MINVVNMPYVIIDSLFTFQQLNFTGFRKILKKHDKVHGKSQIYYYFYVEFGFVSFWVGKIDVYMVHEPAKPV